MNLESTVKKLFLGGTAVVAGAVSLMAAQTFAVSQTGPTAINGVSSFTNFSLTVDKALTLSANPSSDPITAVPGQVATGTLSVGVQTNSPYTISLYATQPNLVKQGDNTKVITASSDVSNTPNSWGIKKMTSSNAVTGDYVALTSNSTNSVFLDSTNAAPSGVPSNFEIGVHTTTALAEGTYSTTVTVVAAVK